MFACRSEAHDDGRSMTREDHSVSAISLFAITDQPRVVHTVTVAAGLLGISRAYAYQLVPRPVASLALTERRKTTAVAEAGTPSDDRPNERVTSA